MVVVNMAEQVAMGDSMAVEVGVTAANAKPEEAYQPFDLELLLVSGCFGPLA